MSEAVDQAKIKKNNIIFRKRSQGYSKSHKSCNRLNTPWK